jgi:hypothetical protein
VDLAIAIIGAAAAVAAAIAAFGSWNAATKANASARVLAAIEADRRHDELAPDLEITCMQRQAAPDSADLYVALKPCTLERLDEVTLSILDEAGRDHWTRGLPGDVTQEEAEAFVWGDGSSIPGQASRS